MTGDGLFAALVASAVCFGLTAAMLAPLIGWLRSRQWVDIPNERSSHQRPTPTGGGIVIVCVLLAAWAVMTEAATVHILAAAAGLAGLSLWDDLKTLGALPRLLGHCAAVAAILIVDPQLAAPLAQVLPAAAATVLTGLAWVWFINLFNFMDGIDGIAGVETISIGLGVSAVALVMKTGGDLPLLGLMTAGAAAGFLVWNWHPAKIFMGDVGSVPLGFLLGWLLLTLAADGAWAAALILPGYYLVDATVTLVRRLIRGEAVWRAHREHFYQAGVQNGLSHDEVSGFIVLGNAVLLMLAVASAGGRAMAAGALAAGVICALMLYFKGRKRGA